jgi:hypothetical protein
MKWGAMSTLGQTRRFDRLSITSGLLPTTDILGLLRGSNGCGTIPVEFYDQ